MQAAGEVALEASHGFALGLALGDAPGDVGLGGGVAAHADHDDEMQGPVELADAAAVEAVPAGIPGGRGDGAGPGQGGECGLGADSAGVGPRDEHDGGGDGTDTGQREQVGSHVLDELLELGGVGLDLLVQGQDLPGEAGGLGAADRDVDGLVVPGPPGGDLPQLGHGQRSAGIDPQVGGSDQGGQDVDRGGVFVRDHVAADQQDPQGVSGAVCARDTQLIDIGAQDGPGDPDRIQRVGLAHAAVVRLRLPAGLDDPEAGPGEGPGHAGAVRPDPLDHDQGRGRHAGTASRPGRGPAQPRGPRREVRRINDRGADGGDHGERVGSGVRVHADDERILLCDH